MKFALVGFFVDSTTGLGKTGLSDVVFNGFRCDETGATVETYTNLASSEKGVGLYQYVFDEDLVGGWVEGVFSTASIAVKEKVSPSFNQDWAKVWATELARLDVATSTRLATAGYTAPDNSAIGLIKAVTDKVNGMLELFGGLYRFTVAALVNSPSATTPAQFWSYSDRTLTNPLVSYTNIPAANTINAGIGETVDITVTGLGSLAGRGELYWTLKRANGSPDSAAIVQISENGDLLVLNGDDTIPLGVVGTLTVDDEDAGDITISLEAELTTLLPALEKAKWDVKYVSATVKSVKAKGRMNISYNTTEAIA